MSYSDNYRLRERGFPQSVQVVCGGILLIGIGATVLGESANGWLFGDTMVKSAVAGPVSNAIDDSLEAEPSDAYGVSAATTATPAATDDTARAANNHYEVVLTCDSGGASLPVSSCIAATGDNAGGQLTVATAEERRTYSETEVLTELSSVRVSFPFDGPFDVQVITNSAEFVTLKAELRENGRTIHTERASGLVPIELSSGG